MRICLVSQEYPPETGWGGIGTYTRHLAEGLVARGHHVDVVTRVPPGGAPSWTGRANLVVVRTAPRVRRFPGRRWMGRSVACLEYAAAVARAVARFSAVDVVEVPNWNAEGFWLVRARHRAPVVTRIHSPYAAVLASRDERLTLDKRLSVALERSAVCRSEAVVTHSRYNAGAAAKLYGLDADALALIPHGIPMPSSMADPPRTEGTMRILFVGRLERRKGIHVLLDAIPAVLDAVPETEVVIAGRDFPSAPSGRTWQEHAHATLSERHQRRVQFLGYVDGSDLERLYRECHLFVAPSLYESFGLVYLEAMARGRPVIGARVAAIPEVVADGETGLLPPPRDAKGLAGAIIRLLRNDEERIEMGRRAYERVKRLFDRETMVDQVVELYEQVRRGIRPYRGVRP